jgi:hypothetical protein
MAAERPVLAIRPNWDNSSDLNALPDPVVAGLLPAIRVIASEAKQSRAARDCFVAYGSSQ